MRPDLGVPKSHLLARFLTLTGAAWWEGKFKPANNLRMSQYCSVERRDPGELYTAGQLLFERTESSITAGQNSQLFLSAAFFFVRIPQTASHAFLPAVPAFGRSQTMCTWSRGSTSPSSRTNELFAP